jgi:hypothetical protein
VAAKPAPESHLAPGGAAAPATTATPAKPEAKPEPKPATQPPAKPEPKPAAPKPGPMATEKPTATPAAKPPAKPEPKPAEPAPAAKPEAKPPAETPKPAEAPKPAPTPEPAKPQAPATTQPVPSHNPKYANYPSTNPDGSGPKKDQPGGELKLGRRDDPVAGKIWGQDDKYGPVAFNHANHTKPTYAASCQSCHHTNTDTKTEGAIRCVACHRESGYEKNPAAEDGTELDVKNAYHGVNEGDNSPGCITCHRARGKGPTGCAECHMSGSAAVLVFTDDLASLVTCHDSWV